MADALDSKSGVSDGVRVRVPPPVPSLKGLLQNATAPFLLSKNRLLYRFIPFDLFSPCRLEGQSP